MTPYLKIKRGRKEKREGGMKRGKGKEKSKGLEEGRRIVQTLPTYISKGLEVEIKH